jgi:hypothetical protein
MTILSFWELVKRTRMIPRESLKMAMDSGKITVGVMFGPIRAAYVSISAKAGEPLRTRA